jgi:hypothetical protein
VYYLSVQAKNLLRIGNTDIQMALNTGNQYQIFQSPGHDRREGQAKKNSTDIQRELRF